MGKPARSKPTGLASLAAIFAAVAASLAAQTLPPPNGRSAFPWAGLRLHGDQRLGGDG